MNPNNDISLSKVLELIDSIESSNIKNLRRVFEGVSFYKTLDVIQQKEKIKFLSKNKDEKFIKDILYWLNEKQQKDIHQYSKGQDKNDIKHFINLSDEKLKDFKNKLFIGLVGNLKSDDIKALNVLNLYWPDRKNVNQLAKKCGILGLKSITHKLMSEFKKPKEDSIYQVNINYFLKNVVKESSIEFLDILWKDYSRDIKQVFQYLCARDQFWLYENPKEEGNSLKNQRAYNQDSEIFNITNFSYANLKWFEEKGIGLKQANYSGLDLFIPLMSSNEIRDYIKTNPVVIINLIKGYLDERKHDASWLRYCFDDEYTAPLTIHNKVSNLIFKTSLEQGLSEKPIAKPMKI